MTPPAPGSLRELIAKWPHEYARGGDRGNRKTGTVYCKLSCRRCQVESELKKLEEAAPDLSQRFEMAKQRVDIVERVMKLPYIKAQRDTEKGQERFVCRDDVITAVREAALAAQGTSEVSVEMVMRACGRFCHCATTEDWRGLTMNLNSLFTRRASSPSKEGGGK